MQIEINPRGNGACPLCNSGGRCRVQDTITNAMELFSDEDNPMEMVVYSCPRFREKKERE